MALLFMDGFDHYATADITKKWSTSVGPATISSAAGRRSGGALAGSIGNNAYVVKNITAGATFIMGAAFQFPGASSIANDLFRLLDATTLQCGVRVNGDGTLLVHRNGTTLATSTAALAFAAYNYIEWKVTIADSIATNSCKVRLNGVDVLTLAAASDTKNTANASANQVSIGGISGNATSVFVDDFYLCDASGSTNNDFLGDCRVDTLLPNGDGNYTSLTPSTGVSHYLLVDETAPNTTDYNESSTATNKDSYQMVNLGALASQTIYGVQALGAVLKDDAGARSIKVGMRSSSTDSSSAAQALSTSQLYYSNIHETDPATATAWTESGVNAAEALFEVA